MKNNIVEIKTEFLAYYEYLIRRGKTITGGLNTIVNQYNNTKRSIPITTDQAVNWIMMSEVFGK